MNSKKCYSITYNIGKYTINEEYNNRIKNGYYFNIIKDDSVYSYEFHGDFLGKKIVTDIKSYNDCILPIFNGEIIFDITCPINKHLSSGIFYMYLHNMSDVSDELNKFVESIGEYDINKFKDDATSVDIDKYELYNDNITKNISVETYRGIIINDKKIDLFDSDQYNKLSIYTNNYYVVPTYKTNYEFNELYIINLNTKKVKTLKFEYNISYSSYVQGIYNDIIYLMDEDNKKQYEIDCKKLQIRKIGDLSNNINIYENGKWFRKTIADVVENKYKFDFKNYREKIDDNNYRDTINDFIYSYVKKDDGYEVYKSNKYTPNIKNYLFDLSDVNSVIYDGDYLYFKKDNYIGRYSEKTGIKKIIQSNELLFNQNISYTVTL